jgi:Leucine-rich repeat (LRR) protein
MKLFHEHFTCFPSILFSNFRLTKLPAVLYTLPKLEILFANDNKIETIDPQGMKQLASLATLDLQNNNIGQVPPELGLCKQIKYVQHQYTAVYKKPFKV